jgi:hypothetical protein
MAQGILMMPEYDKQRAAQIAQASAPQPAAGAPELTDKQRRSAALKGILYALAGIEKGGIAGGILGGMEGAKGERERTRYEGYLDQRLKRGDMTTEQRDALMARRYAGEQYGATSRPWWSSSQKPQIISKRLPGGMMQDIEMMPTGERRDFGAPYPQYNPNSYGSRRSDTPTAPQDAKSRGIQEARDWVMARSPAQRAKDVKYIEDGDPESQWIAKQYALASVSKVGEDPAAYQDFMDTAWGKRKRWEAETGTEAPKDVEEEGGANLWNPFTWFDGGGANSVDELDEAINRGQ